MASQQESTGRETRQNRGQHLRVLLQMEKGRHLERSTSTRALPSAERSLLEDHPSSRTAGEAQNLLSERAGGDAGATSQPAQPPESVVPKQFLPSVPESAPPAPPSAAALKQPLPSAPDPAPIPAASKQPLQPTTVVDFCVEVNPEMNGIPAEVKFLECAQIWTQEANSNLRIGIRVSQDVEFVAGDFVSITHKAKQKAKTGNMTVVCVERRKDKLYLVGVPDKDLLPPPHAGPNQSSPYYSCPLLKSEWSIVVLKHSELNDSVNGRLKAAIVQYIANQAKKGNEGSLVEAPDSNAPYLRASARTKVARLNQREQSAQIERDKSLALKKKKRRTNALQKQKVSSSV